MENNVINNKDNNSSVDALRHAKNEVQCDESAKSHAKKPELNKEKSLTGLHFLKQSFRTLSVPKKSIEKTIEKDKNEPSRFLGEGVTFKAKLIGILEVEEARGDRMCQEALFELKMAVRAAGEHKQRINIVIAIDGIRLRDEKTGDCLHHHPVHKISFIAQDVADSRAFGYIFGSPDTTHRFFGIKTDKAASQVVMAMRDLFQAVYELKKREVEMAKQNIEQHQMKYGSSLFLDTIPASAKNVGDSAAKSKPATREDTSKNVKNKTQTAGVIADLMDLELELNSLQQGLSQMERLTPNDPFGPFPSMPKEDPFGDSFTPPPCITTPPPAKLPPPPAAGDRRKIGSSSSAASQPELHWFDRETQDLFSTEKNTTVVSTETSTDKEKKEESRASEATAKDLYDIFTELDPLGTGRSKPYMDKKDFFQELKNPPKKLLKDFKNADSAEKNNTSTGSFGNNNSKSLFAEETTEKLYDDHFRKYNSVDSDRRITLAEELAKSDPYYESGGAAAPADPFETSFANFATFDGTTQAAAAAAADEPRRSPHNYRRSPASLQNHHTHHTSSSKDTLHGMLKSSSSSSATNFHQHHHTSTAYRPMFNSVGDDTKQQPSSSVQTTAESFSTKTKSKWNDDRAREKIVINLRRVLSSADDTDKENDSPVMEEATVLKNLEAASPSRGTGGHASSDSFESIPEPPPRPITSPTVTQPPPLPPKKLQLPVTLKPPPRPVTDASSHYDYIENYESLGSRQHRLNGDVTIPPLPAPVRRPRCGHAVDRDTIRHRPHKQYTAANSECEYYLTPISKSRPEEQHRQRSKATTVKPSSLNITISQLTSTGFEDLANMLRIPVSALSKMTLKELTECLSRLSDAECQKLESEMSNRNRGDHGYRSLKEPSFEEDSTTFKANFDDKFSGGQSDVAATSATSANNPQVDKYAVFRELIEQEEMNQRLDKRSSPSPSQIRMDNVDGTLSPSVHEDKDSSYDPAIEKSELHAEPLVPPSESNEEAMEQETAIDDTTSQPDESPPVDDIAAPSKTEIEGTEMPTTPSEDKNAEGEAQSAILETLVVANDDERNDKVEKDGPENELGQNWAKFDSEQAPAWRDENKISEFVYEKDVKTIPYRRPKPRRKWNDDEEDDDDLNDDDYGDDSEENWESSKRSLGSSWDESSWRENGWSDRDSLYDDAEASPASYREQKYHQRRKGYHRRFKGDDHSPWDEEAAMDWQSRKPLYKDYLNKDGAEPLYDEQRKLRSSPWSGDRKRYETDEDDLKLLKMVLGKKRLIALEEQLFKHYHEQLAESPKKSYYHYTKSSSKESPADDEYIEIGGGRPRHNKKYYTQRPKSADKGRKPQPLKLRPEDTEELFSSKKYRRPYSHDELSISEEERWARRSPAYPKPSSTSSRSRNQSQTSPFEDNFTSQAYEFTDSPSETASSTHAKSKTLRYPSAGKKGPDAKRSLELHPYSTYDFKSGRSSRESSQRQSPFEDDFAPPEKETMKQSADDVFYTTGGGESGRSSRNNARMIRMSRHDHQKRADKLSKYYENVDLRKKMPDAYYEKMAKEKYKYGAATSEKSDDVAGELKSPKKNKAEGRRHDPFNDSVPGYDSKTMPRLQKAKSKSKPPNYESESDSAGTDGPKWKDMSSFAFSDQHGRK